MSGSSDEEGKSMKNSDTEEQDKKTDTEEEVQEEEEETDTEPAADAEVSDKLVVLSSGEENDDLPSKKQKYASLNQLNNVKSGPDLRHSSRQDKNEADQSSSTRPQENLNLNAKDLIRFYKPLYQLPDNEHYLLDSLNFLFMNKLVATDIMENKLYILKKEAEEHFRALNTSKISEVEIEIYDAENETYNMKLLVYPETSTNSDAYKITWKSFVEKHKLEVVNEISFYKPGRPLKGNHYAIRFEKKKKEQT
ncbi:unnamed protein product [Camellia sinensis]